MNRIARFMSKRRSTWLPWMLLGTPFVLLSFVLMVAIDTLIHWRASWHYDWRYQWSGWFRAFTDAHRQKMHSLGNKPEPGGVLVVLMPGDMPAPTPTEVPPKVTLQ